MEITIENHKPYTVEFIYGLKFVSFFKKRKKQEIAAHNTKCLITQESVPIAEAVIVCGSGDIPQKKFGDIKAFAKTLELLPPSREEKKEFWKQYHELSKV